jgi:hypothetical protein
VDLEDLVWFTTCVSGPRTPPSAAVPVWECLSTFDFDHDKDIDLADFQVFQDLFGSVLP